MNRIDQLSCDIENVRQEMHESIEKEHYIISSKSVTISQRLDNLIVEYNLMTSKGIGELHSRVKRRDHATTWID